MNQSRRPSREEVRESRIATAQTVGAEIRDRLPLPERGLGEDGVRRAYELDDDEDRRVVRFPAHLRRLFSALSEADVDRIEKLLALRPETVTWISGKSAKELASMDGVVEFVSSSRTAAKVLMWVCGTATAAVLGAIALAKGGFDLFKTIRGG